MPDPPVARPRAEPLPPTNGEAREEARYTIPPVLLVDSTRVLPGELGAERTIASDPSRGIDERLEALENIVDSEIGDTTLARSRNVEREVGIRQLFLKFEGSNATGTQKDRIAFAQASDAVRRGFVSVTAATCGNYGVAMALAATCAGLECFMYIPRNYSSRRIEEMERLGTKIVREGEDYEGAVAASRGRAERDDIYDANPGGANTALQLKAYGEIAYEIYDQLRDAPAIVAVPVSNGTTLAGIYRGFLSLYRRGRTSRMPRMVAGSSYRKNPIVHSFLKGAATYEDLEPGAIRETETNEPLINWHSAEGDDALNALRATNGSAAYASDRNLKAISRLVLEKEGLSVLPAAAAGLIALIEMHERTAFPNDRYVAVLTGRK